MPTLRSRAVSEDGYYEIDFSVFGISLTKISRDEWLLLPQSRGVYLLTNQYLEGTDYLNYHKRMDIGGIQQPTGTVFDGIYLDAGIICENPGYNTTVKLNEHNCKFVRYVGLSESFNHCESCGKKQ